MTTTAVSLRRAARLRRGVMSRAHETAEATATGNARRDLTAAVSERIGRGNRCDATTTTTRPARAVYSSSSSRLSSSSSSVRPSSERSDLPRLVLSTGVRAWTPPWARC
eukprot:26189-Pelagococcus_subviridis.AAC.1